MHYCDPDKNDFCYLLNQLMCGHSIDDLVEIYGLKLIMDQLAHTLEYSLPRSKEEDQRFWLAAGVIRNACQLWETPVEYSPDELQNAMIKRFLDRLPPMARGALGHPPRLRLEIVEFEACCHPSRPKGEMFFDLCLTVEASSYEHFWALTLALPGQVFKEATEGAFCLRAVYSDRKRYC